MYYLGVGSTLSPSCRLYELEAGLEALRAGSGAGGQYSDCERSEPSSQRVSQMSGRALIVDNDFFFVEFLAELLEKRGYEVIKAFDGKEGISKLDEGPIDLLFSDMLMPKIDGKQLIEFARMKFPDARFPIISVSSTIIEQLDVINEIGADYYIAKGPIEQMGAQLNTLMDRIEKRPFVPPTSELFFEPKNLYPRQATVELIDTVNFQRAITESIGIGIIVVDRDARIMNTNSLALDIINKSIVEVLNRPITTIFPTKEKARLIGALKKVIHNPELRKTTFSVTIHSQEIRIIVSLFKKDGGIDGWIIAMEDASQWVEEASS